MTKFVFSLSTCMLLSFTFIYAQRIEHPTYETKNGLPVELIKIILSDTTTTLHVEFTHYADEVTEINSSYFIKTNSGEKLPMKYALESKTNNAVKLDSLIHFKEDGKTSYLLVFPPISSSVLLLDLNQKDKGSTLQLPHWGFFGIKLKDKN